MRRLKLLGLLLLVSLALPACNEEGAISVHSIRFSGVNAVDEARLREAIATRENTKVPLLGLGLPWGRKRYFDRGRFDADLKRIQAFYADRGYPDARVTAFDVKLNDEQTSVDIRLTIAEGEPVRVASVGYVGFDVLPPNRLEALQNESPLETGRPRDRQDVVAAHEAAVNELRDHGYPYARVNTEENDGPSGKEAAVVFTAVPGTLAYFGAVEIAGNESVSDRIIERELTYRTGELYRRSVVQNSQRRLYGLQLFQFVNIEPLDLERESPELKTRVTVAEGKHQRVHVGAGYGTEEKARVDGEYHHVNFFGGARSAGAHGRWSSLDRGVRLDFNQPYFLQQHFSLGVETQQWYTFTPAYRSTITGGKLMLTHRNDVRMSWSVSLTHERDTSAIQSVALDDPTLRDDLIALGLDPTTGRQEGSVSALGFDFQRSTADNVLNAHRGYQLVLRAEDAGRFLPGSFSYSALSADARHYQPLGDDLVFASRLQLGTIHEDNDDPANVPFSKKYFLGGATSLRGWGRYEISPLSDSGFPIGGNSLLALSGELRAVLKGNLGGVLFVDAGNVWAGTWGFELGNLRYAVGPGVRYQTPVGPVRFDIGYQLNPLDNLLVNGEPQQRRWRLHFSIGQAF
jgi:outer membrane protein insertion porin family/translocation and assembly module TamA